VQIAVSGVFLDRVHDLILSGVDPALIDTEACLDRIEQVVPFYAEMDAFLQLCCRTGWSPRRHAFLFGPQLKAWVFAIALVEVQLMYE
jgi:hypothetical protein